MVKEDDGIVNSSRDRVLYRKYKKTFNEKNKTLHVLVRV